MIMSQSAQSDIYRPIIEQIADAIIYSDSEGIIRVWNAAAMEIFGYTKEELLNQSFERIQLSKESFDKFSLEYKKFENSILTNCEFPF